MPVNNIDKAMVGKGEMKVAEKDPMTHIDLELMDVWGTRCFNMHP